ncbi:MAG: hypothetical protein HFI31_10475 [Lachnospiraceae bacterium]|jgi:hypothetical protein|nr:hypothetical protein [Lachnospiraceae bacterium]MCI8996175.1 hypothetical protein [Lachnospiraceae bacterium]MCI9134597.1 hypothetical protein [Lachnospiraceae bacterium]
MKGRKRKNKRRKNSRMPALILAVCMGAGLLSGCTPREKTIRLPDSQAVETEQQSDQDDFTVKRIYTYDYNSDPMLDRSAFLADCGAHEVRILASGSGLLESGYVNQCLESRQVDYRYGFYDADGELSYEELSDYYVDKILISPTGKQALLYEESQAGDVGRIWLYNFQDKSAYLLYERSVKELQEQGYAQRGEESWEKNEDLNSVLWWEKPLGSWSESGRWVTFDAMGIYTSGIYLYDTWREDVQYKNPDREFLDLDSRTVLNAKGHRMQDQELESIYRGEVPMLSAEIFDYQEGAGSLFFIEEDGRAQLRGVLQYPLSEPDASWEEQNFQFNEFYIYCPQGDFLPYLGYELDMHNKYISYLFNFRRVDRLFISDNTSWTILENPEEERDWSPLLLDFQCLDGQRILMAVSEESYYLSNMEGAAYTEPESGMFWSLRELQQGLSVNSVNLYLYSPLEGERQLLYKGLKNLIHMEYDESSRRILLETWEGIAPEYGQRRCTILEL